MVCPGTMTGVPAAIASEAVAVPTPPVPVAVRVTVVVALSCGVPVISPVKALISSPAGRPVADQLLTGRFVESVSAGVTLNAAPTLPCKVCPAGMSGAPPAMVKVTVLCVLVPPLPIAAKFAVKEPLVVGVPVMAPVA